MGVKFLLGGGGWVVRTLILGGGVGAEWMMFWWGKRRRFSCVPSTEYTLRVAHLGGLLTSLFTKMILLLVLNISSKLLD